MVMAQEQIVAINPRPCQTTCQTGNHLLVQTGKPLLCRIICRPGNHLLHQTGNLRPLQTDNRLASPHRQTGQVRVHMEVEDALWVAEVEAAAVLAVAAEEDDEILPV